MNQVLCAFLLAACLFAYVQADEPKPPEPKVGEPQYSLQGAGGGNNHRNFELGYNAGLGTRVWESKKGDMSVDLGVNYGRGIARMDGQTFKSPPQYGFGGRFNFGRK